MLVGHQEVHVGPDHRQERVPVPLHAEGVGERDRHLAAVRLGGADRLAEGRLAVGAVEAVALEEDPFRPRHLGLVDILRREEFRDPEIGVHRPLAVRGHQHHAAPGLGRVVARRERRGIARPLRPQVMGEDRAELVVLDLAHIGRARPERREPGDGIGRRAARDLARRPHAAVELDRARGVDQLHDALLDAVLVEEALLDRGDDIDDRIADADDLDGLAQIVFSSKSQRSRIRQAAQAGLRALQT